MNDKETSNHLLLNLEEDEPMNPEVAEIITLDLDSSSFRYDELKQDMQNHVLWESKKRRHDDDGNDDPGFWTPSSLRNERPGPFLLFYKNDF